MKYTLIVLLSIVLFSGSYRNVAAQGDGRAGTNGGTPDDVQTGIATMYARDPLTQSLCYKDGGPGGSFQGGKTKNRCSDLNFNSYSPNGFSVGVEGGREGVILDLGTPEELKAKYGYTETVGNGQGYASIDVRARQALILADYQSGKLQPLAESASLFQPGKGVASVPVKLGHIYLMRTTDRHDKAFEVFAKVLVIAYTPNESVTVRWQLIGNSETSKLRD